MTQVVVVAVAVMVSQRGGFCTTYYVVMVAKVVEAVVEIEIIIEMGGSSCSNGGIRSGDGRCASGRGGNIVVFLLFFFCKGIKRNSRN